MGILLFELFRNPLFMGILNKWETLANNSRCKVLGPVVIEHSIC